MNHSKIFLISIAIIIVFTGNSCKKFIEVPPPSDQLAGDQVFTSDATATSAVVGIYSNMMSSGNLFTASSITLYTGLYSDEMSLYEPDDNRDEFINSKISQTNHSFISTWIWAPAYKYIYTANLCIEKLEHSTGLTPAIKNTLIGEAKFIRAFCFFHLVNLFGDTPLTLSSDYTINASLPRTAQADVYKQMILDLEDAKNLLPVAYISGADRIRPNKWASTALLARVYLYNKNWTAAEQASSVVISSGAYSLNPNLNNVFLKASTEAIWQLQPVIPNWNTWEGRLILFSTSSTQPTYILREGLINSFEPDDTRKAAWVGSRIFLGETINYPNKYKVYGDNAPITEYYMVLRLAEQYLIRAEARTMTGNMSGAIEDINVIRNRAGLPNTTASDKESLLTAIAKERQHELFAEWGHRWYDLKRTNKADEILSTLKPLTWDNHQLLWPVPVNQINANPALIQNPGY